MRSARIHPIMAISTAMKMAAETWARFHSQRAR
jgi:hypothetical protein